MKMRKLVSLGIVLCLAISSLTGCKKTESVSEENVELVDPVGMGDSYAVATYRNIYDSQIISATVSPKVTEYSFGDDQLFSSYGFLPGNKVSNQDTLIYAGTKSVDDKIKAQKELISNMDEQYEESYKEMAEQYAEDKSDEAYWAQILDNVNSKNPGEDSAKYEAWKAEFTKYDGMWRKAWLAYARSEENIKELTELYNLDRAYAVSVLKRLQTTRKQATINAAEDGVVVALNYYEEGDRIAQSSPVIALGDLNSKEIKCSYINSGIINKAEDVYAIINGKRYEIEYQAIDSEEYNRINKLNGVVYSTFILSDPNNEVEVGTFATIVIINSIKENVLCVPTDAISKDDSGYFVYRFNGNTNEHVEIKKGSSDGAYTEVLTGLNEGDKVLTEFVVTAGEATAKLTKGDIGSSFTATGYLYYPVVETIKNPVEYGTVYLEEICVSRYQQVAKGDVLAKIRVIPDSITIARKERTIQRLNERINDLRKEDATANEKQIKAKQEQIADIQEDVAKMKKDAATTEITAPYDCIVTSVTNLQPESIVRPNERLLQISESSSSYILVEEDQNRLNYGNIASISYDDGTGKKKNATGMVATVNNLSLSANMNVKYSLILISADDIADMAGSSMGYEGWWNRSRFSVSIPIREMKNVILVPRKAVKDIGGSLYVKVKKEDGTVDYRSFISGGSDSTYYWVVEGLTEGTEVCLE